MRASPASLPPPDAPGTPAGARRALPAQQGPEPSPGEVDREIWSLAWPAILSFVVVNLVDMVDVGLVGRLGRQTVAAWGYATQYENLVETLIVAVGSGAVALMARAVGAREMPRARRVLAASMVVTAAVSGVGLLLVLTVPEALLALLDAKPAVIAKAVPYFRLTATAMVLYGFAFMFECGLRAQKNTRAAMLIAVAVMSVKTVLSVLLVFGLLGFPRLELVGAGIATLSAHAVGLILFATLSRTAERRGAGVALALYHLRGTWEIAREVLRVSLPAMGERLVMNLALLTYFRILSSYGTAAIAAYAIGVRLLAISWVPGLGFAAAASALVGQALGEGRSGLARTIGFRAVRQALLLMCGIGVVFFFVRTPLARQFTDDAQVAQDLAPFMLMLALAQPFMGAHFTLGGVLRGAGDTMTPLIGAAIGNWGLRVPLAWIFARWLGTDLRWVWCALIFDHFARLVVNVIAFAGESWSRKTGASLR